MAHLWFRWVSSLVPLGFPSGSLGFPLWSLGFPLWFSWVPAGSYGSGSLGFPLWFPWVSSLVPLDSVFVVFAFVCFRVDFQDSSRTRFANGRVEDPHPVLALLEAGVLPARLARFPQSTVPQIRRQASTRPLHRRVSLRK